MNRHFKMLIYGISIILLTAGCVAQKQDTQQEVETRDTNAVRFLRLDGDVQK